LKRLFFAFPGGWPGTALFLMRVVFGLTVLVEGKFYIAEANATAGSWTIGVSAMVAGGLLVVGLMTPVIGTIVAAGVVGVGVSILPRSVPTLFDSLSSLIFGLTVLVAIVSLGPGAFSLDARLFGRREIIIPPRGVRPQE
jgi:uncharacterized membrane protein YphA (DoxX/SURF4 family)